jgi:hypothetical protein
MKYVDGHPDMNTFFQFLKQAYANGRRTIRGDDEKMGRGDDG